MLRGTLVIQYFIILLYICDTNGNLHTNPYELRKLFGQFLQICRDFEEFKNEEDRLDVLKTK